MSEINQKTIGSVISDLKRALANRKIEVTPEGLMVLGDTNISIGGVFDTWVNRHELVQKAIDEKDHEKEAWARKWVSAMGFDKTGQGYFSEYCSADHNLIPDGGINYILNVIFGSTAKLSNWYVGLFTSDHTPAPDWGSNWAGATSGPDATELANAAYNETNRQLAVFGSATTKTIATSSATVFTLATGQSNVAIYGATLNSVSTVAYNEANEILLAATKFGSPKTGLGAADVINVSYSITGSST